MSRRMLAGGGWMDMYGAFVAFLHVYLPYVSWHTLGNERGEGGCAGVVCGWGCVHDHGEGVNEYIVRESDGGADA
jgi:hypothetical protein